MKLTNPSLRSHETLRAGFLRVVNGLVDSVTECAEHYSENGESVHEVRPESISNLGRGVQFRQSMWKQFQPQ